MVLVLLFFVNTGGHLMLYPALGMDENSGVLVSLVLILIGVALGLTGSVVNRQMRWHLRALVVVSFVPVIGASLVISGL